MKTAYYLLAGFSLAASCAPVSAHCLSSRRPIEGQLSVMRIQTVQGRAIKGYQIELAQAACAYATGLDGGPVLLQGVRTVQVLTSSLASEQKLDGLTGEKIVIAGYLDAPDPERHTGDAVLASAWLIAVPSTAAGAGNGGTPAVAADNGQPDEAEAGAPASQLPEPSHTDIAIAGPDGAATPYAIPPPDPERAGIETRLAAFVTNFYLSGQNASPELLRGIYARRVSYFGKSTGIEDVIRDKLTYYGRWPVRAYTLVPGTLAIRPLRGDGRVYELTFEYDFKVASAGKKGAGTGYARLQVDLADGHGQIVRESGKVIGPG